MAASAELALKLGQRRSPEPVLVTVRAQAAAKSGLTFTGYGEDLYLAPALSRPASRAQGRLGRAWTPPRADRPAQGLLGDGQAEGPAELGPLEPHRAARLLRDWHASSAGPEPDLKALYMATLTLTRMAEGGLFDQLGGGFCRYSVDAYWMIPHFEKMLYDNALLARVYVEAYQVAKQSEYRRVACEVLDYVLRDMTGPSGGFYSATDADCVLAVMVDGKVIPRKLPTIEPAGQTQD